MYDNITSARSLAPAPADSRLVPVQVIARAPAARDAVTFWLTTPGTTRAPAPYRPGQFITLAFTPPSSPSRTNGTARGGQARPARTLYRSYSLCGNGDPNQPWEITIKRQQSGVVSGFLFDHVAPGMVLHATQPVGAFTLPSRIDAGVPFVFIAGGSGITPLYGMLRALASLAPAARPRVYLHYAYRGAEDAIYGRQLASLDPERQWLMQWHYRSAHQQRLTPMHVLLRLQDDGIDVAATQWYVCGPGALNRTMSAMAERAGVPRSHFHAEVFASAQRPAAAAAAQVARGVAPRASDSASSAAIRVAETGAVLNVLPEETLLDALERHGYEPDFSCRAGSCGTCRLRLLGGRVAPAGGDPGQALMASERAAGYIVSCSTRPVGEVTLSLAGVPAPATIRPSWPAAVGGGTAVPMARPGQIPRRAATRRRLRWSVGAASVALFASVWGLTSHRAAANPASGISAPSLPSFSAPHTDDGNGDDSGGSNSSSQAPSTNGPSFFNPQPGSSQPNTSSGTS